MSRILFLLFSFSLLLPFSSLAQKKTKETSSATEPSEPSFSPTDDDGNPIGSADSPSNIVPKTPVVKPRLSKKAVTKENSYPIEKIYRPLTLPKSMTEISFAMPLFVDPFMVNGVLSANVGIRSNMQVGLVYNVGGVTTDDFETGKAFGVEGRYKVYEWLSGQLRIPINTNPFASALTLGAPMQFNFFDTLRFEFAEDLVSIKMNKFIPSLQNAATNAANAAAQASNTISARIQVNVSGHVFYQWRRNQVIEGHFGIIKSFDGTTGTTDDPVFLHLGFMHSFSNSFDLSALAGSDRLDDPLSTLFIQGALALRF